MPESQAARIARLEEQLRAAESRADDDRRFIQPLAPMVAGHSIRLDDMVVGLTEIKATLKSLDATCAKASEVTELKKTIETRGEARRASRALIIVSCITAAGTVVAALIATGAFQ